MKFLVRLAVGRELVFLFDLFLISCCLFFFFARHVLMHRGTVVSRNGGEFELRGILTYTLVQCEYYAP